MATNSPGATGSRERRFRNILGASWELGAWEFIAQNGLLGGHLGNQNRCMYALGMPLTGYHIVPDGGRKAPYAPRQHAGARLRARSPSAPTACAVRRIGQISFLTWPHTLTSWLPCMSVVCRRLQYS